MLPLANFAGVRPSVWLSSSVALIASLGSVVRAAPALTTLYSFENVHGAYPRGGLTIDGAGNLYGVTSSGAGAGGDGTLFKIDAVTRQLTTIATLSSSTTGRSPVGLTADSQGDLYGVAQSGGASDAGTVFKYSASPGTLAALAAFNGSNGAAPMAALALDSSGTLFGATLGGGANNTGTIFSIPSAGGPLTRLASFGPGRAFSGPAGRLTIGPGGDLYGTTVRNGVPDVGTLFRYRAGVVNTLWEFDTPASGGFYPSGGILFDLSGDIVGATSQGGAYGPTGNGTIFQYSVSTQHATTRASFNIEVSGSSPQGELLMDAAGNIFGATYTGGANGLGGGVIYRLDHNSATPVVLAAFNGANGENPTGSLIAGPDGTLYGLTTSGGDYYLGTVFSITGSGYVVPLQPCPGDVNGDGQRNTVDLATLLAQFGRSGAGLDGDLDRDGVVNTIDLAMLLAYFGVACP